MSSAAREIPPHGHGDLGVSEPAASQQFPIARLENWWSGLSDDQQHDALVNAYRSLPKWMVTSLTDARFKLTAMRWGGPERGVTFDVPASLTQFLNSKRH
jgi:hypothetical protein